MPSVFPFDENSLPRLAALAFAIHGLAPSSGADGKGQQGVLPLGGGKVAVMMR